MGTQQITKLSQKVFNSVLDKLRKVADWTYEETENTEVHRYDLSDTSIYVYKTGTIEGSLPEEYQEGIDKAIEGVEIENFVSFY